jgi:GNAT superfamily N-acetyltransferase
MQVEGGVRIVRHATGDSFLARAEPWLLLAEAENNLVLGLARQVALYTAAHGGIPYLATVERDGEVIGCAFRTPPWKLILTRMPLDALPALAADVADQYDQLPAALAPVAVAREFGVHWARLRDCSVRDGMRQRLYFLERVVAPERPAPGRLRFATTRDLPLIHEWMMSFAAEAVQERIDVRAIGTERVARREMALWVDGERRCMAGYSGRSPNGVRVGYVYTPPEWRRQGYATTCVAALSQRALDEGARHCFLYTDLSNPTSNDIYQRIGYEPVTDALDVIFEHASH